MHLTEVITFLEKELSVKNLVDIGDGVEQHLDTTRKIFNLALTNLVGRGYTVHEFNVYQLGTNNVAKIKVLAKPGIIIAK